MCDIHRWDGTYQGPLPDLDLVRKTLWARIIHNYLGAKKRKVLEAGVGSGKFSFMLAEEGYEITALDLNNDVLRRLRQKNEKRGSLIRVKKGNILDMPFEDDSFDFVFNEGVVEHFLGCEREKAVSEMIRVSSNGVLIFVPDARSPLYKAYEKDIDKAELDEFPFTRWELKGLCERCGMSNVTLGPVTNSNQIWAFGEVSG